MDVLPAILLFLLPLAAFSIKVVPKVDFGDSGESPGITPGYIKSILEQEEPQVSPGIVKAILEVNVGGLVTKKPETKSESDKDKKKKNEVLICTLDGKCKLHVVQSDNSDDKSVGSDEKTYKPVIVSDFDVDPSTEGNEDDDDKSNEGKDIPKVPVVVGLKGAVKDDDFPYPHTGHGHQVDRLPVYYGMKLSPGFHRPHPQGPVIYEEEPHYPPFSGSYPSYHPQHGVGSYPSYHHQQGGSSYPNYPQEHGVSPFPDYSHEQGDSSYPNYPHGHGVSSYPNYPQEHGVSSYPNYPHEHGVSSSPDCSHEQGDSSYPNYPYGHGVSYLYEQDDDQYPGSIYPGQSGSKPYYNDYFSGSSRPRTPSPYGKFHPTSSPNFQPVITPLHRRVGGGGDWNTRPGVYWPAQSPSNEIPRPENSGWIGSDRPSLYWPSRPDDNPTKHIISVRGKMDEDALKGNGENPKNPIPPKRPGGVVIDGKLGSPLDKTES